MDVFKINDDDLQKSGINQKIQNTFVMALPYESNRLHKFYKK